jgi:lambda family phage portal protein
MFHIFRPGREEEFRGVSCLAAALKFFRHLNDAIDYELMAQVLAASFPVFITLEGGTTYMPPGVEAETGESGEKVYYQNLEFGQFMYGNKGEKPEVLESKRPSQNFLTFCDLILRITASSLEIPYEELTKDFSKTTYSSARAALLEAWRVYDVYRTFFVRHYCQPLYQMVMEEAFLRGYLVLPQGAPGFYEGVRYWCNARWIGPSRGYIDPKKEIDAAIAAMNAGLSSRSQIIAERGDDFDEVSEQRAYERDRLAELGLREESVAAPSPPKEEEDSDEQDEKTEGRNADV